MTAAADPRSMWVALDWIERHCVVPDGFRRGAPFLLYRMQGEYLQHFYLVRPEAPWIPDNPVLAPAFVYRRGLLVGPQKVGKNPLIAAQICLEGVGPAVFGGWAGRDEGYACRDHGCRCGWEYAYELGEPKGMAWPTPLIQITAFSEDSTENTYDALRPMIELGPLTDLIPHTGEEFIRLAHGGRIDTVTSSNQSRLGQRITFAPQDELGLWTRQNKMDKVADTQYRNLAGMGGRASLTTNAWDPAERSVAQREFESKATDVYRQYIEPPKSLSFADKRERRKIFKLVYPDDTRREHDPPGHVDLDSIEAEAADLLEKDAQQARRFFGNERVAGAGHAVDPETWDGQAFPREIEAGTPIGMGFDGSISQDATVLRGCTADGYRFTLGSWVRPVGPDMLGWQAAHPGQEWRVPRTEVRDAVATAFTRYLVGKFYPDPWKWETEVNEWQQLYGEDVVLALDTNSARRFAPVVSRWLTAIREGTTKHDGDPVVAEHVKAAHLRKVHLSGDEADGRTPYLLVKGGDGRKIDGAIADALALEAAMTMPEAEALAEPWVLVR
jgi:hypothetical protein